MRPTVLIFILACFVVASPVRFALADDPVPPLVNVKLNSPFVTDANRAAVIKAPLADVLIFVTQDPAFTQGAMPGFKVSANYTNFLALYRSMVNGTNLDHYGDGWFRRNVAASAQMVPWIVEQYPALAKYTSGYTHAQSAEIAAELGVTELELLPFRVQASLHQAQVAHDQALINTTALQHQAAVEERILAMTTLKDKMLGAIPKYGMLSLTPDKTSHLEALVHQGLELLRTASSSGECFDVNTEEFDRFDFDQFNDPAGRYVRTFVQLQGLTAAFHNWVFAPPMDLDALGAAFEELKRVAAAIPKTPLMMAIPGLEGPAASCDSKLEDPSAQMIRQMMAQLGRGKR
jgi:hypothetical protein